MPASSTHQDQSTELLNAVEAGRLVEAQSLVAAGVPVDTRDPQQATPLMQAAYNGHVELVEWLLSVSASATAVDEGGLTALHWALANGSVASPACACALLAAGSPVDAPDEAGRTPLVLALEWAIQEGRDRGAPNAGIAEAVLELLSRGASLDSLDQYGRSLTQALIEDRTWIDDRVHAWLSARDLDAATAPAPRIARQAPRI